VWGRRDRRDFVAPAGYPVAVTGRASIRPPSREAPVTQRRRQLTAELLLVGVTAIWGSTFVLVKDAVARYPTLPFLTIRFALAALVVLPMAWLGWRRERRVRGTRPRTVLFAGVVMGLMLGAGYIFQTFGLERTSASNAGFITGLFVVLVPLLQGLISRRWVGGSTAAGAFLACLGLFLLSGGSIGGASGEASRAGDGLVFLCAVSFSLHILATDRFAHQHETLVLTFIQLTVVSLGCLLLTGATVAAGAANPGLPQEAQVWIALAVTAVLASAVAFYVQTFAQRHAPPARTAVILTMEPVFAGLFGYFFAGDRLTALSWVGAGLILAGMLITELLPGRRRAGAGPETATPVDGQVVLLPEEGAVWLPGEDR